MRTEKRLPMRIRKQGDLIRSGLIRDLGPVEGAMTTAQLMKKG